MSALNTAMGGAATFTLNSDGSISTANSALYPGYQLNVTGDTTQRGTTGMSFTQLFGLGANALAAPGAGFQRDTRGRQHARPYRLGHAGHHRHHRGRQQYCRRRATIPAPSRCENVINTDQQLSGRRRHLGPDRVAVRLCGRFYQNVSDQSNAVTTNQTTQDDRLQEAQSRQSLRIPASIWTKN